VGESSRLRFESFGRGLPDRGQWRNGFVLADMDGDGHLDIVHGPARKGTARPWVFLGDGAGGWRAQEGLSFPRLRLDYGDVAVADFDGDGRRDLALAMHLRGVLVLVARDGGRFEAWSQGLEFASPEARQGTASFSSRALEVVDWNRDGRPDLLALGEGPRISREQSDARPSFETGMRGPVVFLNGGDGTWEPYGQERGTGVPSGDAIAVADVDGDGLADFFTATITAGIKSLLFLGQADGSWQRTVLDALPDGALVRAATFADFDGDRRADLAVGYLSPGPAAGWQTGLDVLLNGRKGWRRTTLATLATRVGVTAVAAGDLDADGRADLVATTGDGASWVFLGDGKGGFTREAAAGVASPDFHCAGYAIALADLDGAPGDELVASFAGEPGSEVLIAGLERRCPSGGALVAWKAVRP
jgi:hypothetical protein